MLSGLGGRAKDLADPLPSHAVLPRPDDGIAHIGLGARSEKNGSLQQVLGDGLFRPRSRNVGLEQVSEFFCVIDGPLGDPDARWPDL